jgi:hypothetical protein
VVVDVRDDRHAGTSLIGKEQQMACEDFADRAYGRSSGRSRDSRARPAERSLQRNIARRRSIMTDIKGRRHARSGERRGTNERWVASVKTDSTHPDAGLFTKDAATIARALASRKVSPKGPASGMRMLTYFVNRAGRGLSPTRRAELERAKRLLSKRVRRARELRERKATPP